ncbi:nucleotidyl transferase AbiEii/AbiGii toxin family protein [Streptomyces sp. NPDC051555]|uniref:nucleotidyl transferase AbiEii/AbiGii toxin family protein n=1 Tax=Streptomyces sp. NPDC051555 TaxID=3365657 RepID=UPI00379DD835
MKTIALTNVASSAQPTTAMPLSSGAREAEKKKITEIALRAADPGCGLRLGGSRALVLHGLTERVTDDIDLFAPPGQTGYQQPVIEALKVAGYKVEANVSGSGATLIVSSPVGGVVDLEMASSLPMQDAPVVLDGIPVMSAEDCVRLKYSAVCSTKPREKDLIDICGIFEKLGPDCLQQVGVNTLLLGGFFRSLKRVADVSDETLGEFGVAPDRADQIRQYLMGQSGRADEIEEQVLAQFSQTSRAVAKKHSWWACLLPCCKPQND